MLVYLKAPYENYVANVVTDEIFYYEEGKLNQVPFNDGKCSLVSSFTKNAYQFTVSTVRNYYSDKEAQVPVAENKFDENNLVTLFGTLERYYLDVRNSNVYKQVGQDYVLLERNEQNGVFTWNIDNAKFDIKEILRYTNRAVNTITSTPPSVSFSNEGRITAASPNISSSSATIRKALDFIRDRNAQDTKLVADAKSENLDTEHDASFITKITKQDETYILIQNGTVIATDADIKSLEKVINALDNINDDIFIAKQIKRVKFIPATWSLVDV